MLQLKEIYNNNKANLLFDNSTYISDLKKKIINNFDITPKILRNNESLKHFDQKIIKNIKYKFIYDNDDLLFNNNNLNNYSSLYLKNGNLNNLENINQKDILIKVLNSDQSLTENKIKMYENAFLDDYVVNLNSVLMNSGFDIEFKENSSSKIIISNKIDMDNTTVYAKNFFTIKENSKVIIIEKFQNDINSNSNIVNFFDIEKNSEVKHLIIQDNNIESHLQLSSFVNCFENSRYKQTIFNTSKSSIRNHHYVNMLGINADANLEGVFFGTGNQIIDNKTVIKHLQASCTSNQKYKGVLTDHAKASYLSKTFVDQIAQKTEAYQLSKGILLSENSYFHSKPELKIFADDVKCSHGSTIGPFDQDLMFYLRSRGIAKNKATSLLINSFFEDILSSIDEKIYLDLVKETTNKLLDSIYN